LLFEQLRKLITSHIQCNNPHRLKRSDTRAISTQSTANNCTPSKQLITQKVDRSKAIKRHVTL